MNNPAHQQVDSSKRESGCRKVPQPFESRKAVGDSTQSQDPSDNFSNLPNNGVNSHKANENSYKVLPFPKTGIRVEESTKIPIERIEENSEEADSQSEEQKAGDKSSGTTPEEDHVDDSEFYETFLDLLRRLVSENDFHNVILQYDQPLLPKIMKKLEEFPLAFAYVSTVYPYVALVVGILLYLYWRKKRLVKVGAKSIKKIFRKNQNSENFDQLFMDLAATVRRQVQQERQTSVQRSDSSRLTWFKRVIEWALTWLKRVIEWAFTWWKRAEEYAFPSSCTSQEKLAYDALKKLCLSWKELAKFKTKNPTEADLKNQCVKIILKILKA
jgi:hypothetical protein